MIFLTKRKRMLFYDIGKIIFERSVYFLCKIHIILSLYNICQQNWILSEFCNSSVLKHIKISNKYSSKSSWLIVFYPWTRLQCIGRDHPITGKGNCEIKLNYHNLNMTIKKIPFQGHENGVYDTCVM